MLSRWDITWDQPLREFKQEAMIAATTAKTMVESLKFSKGSGSDQSSLSHRCQPRTASSRGDHVSEGNREQPEFTLSLLPPSPAEFILSRQPRSASVRRAKALKALGSPLGSEGVFTTNFPHPQTQESAAGSVGSITSHLSAQWWR